ncbi:DNA primase family protein [Raoultibacter timonensis]|uniref:DNA primase family protein n=1 Tax=Raoultibacter timonensis TaxID=1907662 RepID=UPI0026DD1FB4|nr:DNA primase family protein [Raoultibacter timonensis]
MTDPLFRGYVPTKDKACMVKYKDHPENLMTLEQARRREEYAGVLAEQTVLIDVDDMRQSEVLMRLVEEMRIGCRVYGTTRGKHFLFENDGNWTRCQNGAVLACGIRADVKVGAKNSYSVLKYGGECRPIIWDVDDGDRYQAPPAWLRAVKGAPVFAEMHEGDGRNESLFAHILTLGRAGLTKDEVRECIGIIGRRVLPEPLGEDELGKITRDEAFPERVFDPRRRFLVKGRFRHHEFAEHMVESCPMVSIGGIPHMYRDGIYTCDTDEIERAMLAAEPELSGAHRAEAMRTIRLLLMSRRADDETGLVAFANGLYDLGSGRLLPFSPDRVVTAKVPWDYVPEARSELLDATLSKMACGDPSVVALLEEAVGYCFYRRNELRTAFVLVGEGANGKSTYLGMVRRLLGAENTSALDIRDIGSRFRTAELVNKLANIGDDISDEFMRGELVAQFKKAVTGEMLTAERKGEKPFMFAPCAKMLFSANTIPRIKDDTGAAMSRLAIIPFDATFAKTDGDYDPEISDKLQSREAMEALAAAGMRGLRRVLAAKGFTKSDRVEKRIEEYNRSNNPILGYFETADPDEMENNPTGDAYRAYLQYCHSCGFTPLAHNQFTSAVKRRYGFEVAVRRIPIGRGRKTKAVRVFVKGKGVADGQVL